MKKLSQKNILYMILGLTAALFCAVKYGGPHLVRWGFGQGHLRILDSVLGVAPQEEVRFYLGMTEKLFLGPITYLLAGIFFTVFSLNFLKDARPVVFGVAVFVFLVIVKWEVLFFPVYGGDTVTGPFAEAIWLARHQMDYAALFKQLPYTFGGPLVYKTSIYPSFLALQMIGIPSVKVFLVLDHLISFGLAASVIGILRKITAKCFSNEESILVSVLALSLPLFQAQTEMIHMEFPYLLFTILAASFLVSRRFTAAAVSAVVAVSIKGPGAIACAAVFLVCLIMAFVLKRPKWKVVIPGAAALLIALMFVLANKAVLGEGRGSVGFIQLFRWKMIGRLISNLYLFFLGVFIWKLGGSVKASAGPKMQGIRDFIQQNYPAMVMLVFAGMWFALYTNYTLLCPRYTLLLMPFLVFCGYFSVSSFIRSLRLRKVITVGLILLMFCSSYGLMENHEGDYNYIELERSLEYRNVLHRDVILAQRIEEGYSMLTIGAPSVIAQMLALPELGYVTKKLDVMIYGMTCLYGGIKVFQGIEGLDVLKILWVGYEDDTTREVSEYFPYPIDERTDNIQEKIVYGDRIAYFFVGGASINKMNIVYGKMREAHYKEVMSPKEVSP